MESVSGLSSSTGQNEQIKSTSQAFWMWMTSLLAGEVNPSSTLNSYLKTYSPAVSILLSGTSASAIGGSVTANDMMLFQVTILKNAVAATVTIAGLADQLGAASGSLVLTGSISLDTIYAWPIGLLNGKSALTITPSVTNTALISYNPV